MILEGILTTFSRTTGLKNIAAMGVTVNEQTGFDEIGHLKWFQIKPFEGSRTFANLKELGEGVFHLVDDAELLARSALADASDTALTKAEKVAAPVLIDAVMACEFQVVQADWALPRSLLTCNVVATHAFRQWRGWNRAQNAVLELTILATRVHLIPEKEIRAQLDLLRPLVEKTAGPKEWAGWNFVVAYLERCWKEKP
ncbi:MAG: DUF447 domain-containing protein [bacterium]